MIKQRLQPFKILGGIILIVLGWELVRYFGSTPSYSLPSSSSILSVIPSLLTSSEFWYSFLTTAIHVSASVLTALGLGTIGGYLLLSNPLLHSLIRFPLDFLRSIPAILLYYLLIGLIGLSPERKVLLLGLYLAIPHSIYVYTAFDQTNQRYSLVGRALKLNRNIYQRQILFLASLPTLLGGASVLISWCIVLVLVFEIFTANFAGIGALVYDYYEQIKHARLAALISLIGLIGYTFNVMGSKVFQNLKKRWQ